METTSEANTFKWQQWLWILLLISLLAYLGWLGRTLLESQNLPVDILPGTAQCDIRHAPCVAQRGTQQITFAIDSTELDSKHPVKLRVELAGFESERVEIDLQGRDMFMGENTYSLQRQQDGSYRAEGQLPVCSTDLMTWRATVRIQQGQQWLGGIFDFEAR
ncbi:MAG: hypothetical protein V7739_02915 [Motiliproteus sp.]